MCRFAVSLRLFTVVLLGSVLPAWAGHRIDDYSSADSLALGIPDDGYVGSRASMACNTITVPASASGRRITDLAVYVSADHSYVGDLVIKLYSPVGVPVTLVSRPGFADADDDGQGIGGHGANLRADWPIFFGRHQASPAEDMGAGLSNNQVVGEDGGGQGFAPHQPLTVFDGLSPAGAWSLCLGDAAGGDAGMLASWALSMVTEAAGAVSELELLEDELGAHQFVVTMRWRPVGGDWQSASARALTDETGYFYFTNPDNVEVVVKMKNGCSSNLRFWVFASGLTNQEVEVTVRQVSTGISKVYVNPPQTLFTTQADTNAFIACLAGG